MKRRDRAEHKVGDVLGGRWRLERVLGSGGMGSVFAASDPSGSRVAIKLLHDELVEEDDVVQRFLREARIASAIQHPGVVRVFEQHPGNGEPAYLVMELLEGSTLAERMRAGVPLAEMLDFLDQTLDVLAVAHAAGIVHRDLKPANLFVTTDGRIKVLDFGVARLHEGLSSENRTRTGIALGTLPYMSPEQAAGRQDAIDGRTDVFALGAIVFRHLTGRRIHEASNDLELLLSMVEKPAPPLRSVVPGIAEEVASVVDHALAFWPADRYPSAWAMQEDVRALRSGGVPRAAQGIPSQAHSALPSVEPTASLGPLPPAPSLREDTPKAVFVGLLAVLPVVLAVLAGGGIVIAFVVLVVVPLAKAPALDEQSGREAERLGTERGEFVPLDELLGAAADENKWKQKGYQGRVIRTNGVVTRVERSRNEAVVRLQSPLRKGTALLCRTALSDAASPPSVGSAVTLRGSAELRAGDVNLTGCQVIP